jgi:gamma-glutamyltranspeptidase/glutathione hydrolase
MRSTFRFFQIISTTALVVATACSREPRRTPSIGTEIAPGGPGGFVAPDGWAFPGRHVVATYGADGMVSTTDRVASEMGVEELRRGGNAVDAAIAIHFALAVVNPEAGNIGGGGFMVVRMADGRTATLDFREKAPLAATRDMYLDQRSTLTDRAMVGHLAAAVPGSVAGMWEAHQRFGSHPWAELVQPAVNLAEGIVVHERLAQSLQMFDRKLQRYPATSAAFLQDGRTPRVGDRPVQHDLAETLRRIALDGRDGFYRGRTAALVEAEMRRSRGIVTRDDLGRYSAVWRDPIVFPYRHHTVITMPPPSSGGATMAQILNILEGYDLRVLGSTSTWTSLTPRPLHDCTISTSLTCFNTSATACARTSRRRCARWATTSRRARATRAIHSPYSCFPTERSAASPTPVAAAPLRASNKRDRSCVRPQTCARQNRFEVICCPCCP